MNEQREQDAPRPVENHPISFQEALDSLSPSAKADLLRALRVRAEKADRPEAYAEDLAYVEGVGTTYTPKPCPHWKHLERHECSICSKQDAKKTV